MSHEIRTPMNGILGMTEIALCCELSPEVREHLNLVKQSGDALLTILNDILDFSKIEAGKLELEHTPFNLHQTLDGTMKALSIRASQKGVELLYRTDADVPVHLIGDAHRLRQVVLNLVGNAIKFTNRGEVELSVALELDGRSDDAQGLRLHVAIRDTGIGIPISMQRAIFDAFTQADSSITRQFGGTGLGLAISSRLVALMGGRIWVESERGRGSTFHFTARFSRSPSLDCQEDTQPLTAVAGRSVLIVDDNKASAGILHDLLRSWGMQPRVVFSAEAALAALRDSVETRAPYDLLIVDHQMPEQTGLDLIGRARWDELSTAPVIMMLSTIDLPEVASRCRSIGIDVQLSKPVAREALWEAVEHALASVPQVQAKGDTALPTMCPAAASLRVLVAEDHPVNQKLARLLLERLGHTVTIAENGYEVIRMWRRDPYDVILMDVQMPLVDGLSATLAIRKEEAEQHTGAHIPIVAMTAHAMKGDRERCLEHGMDDYVTKPVQPEVLSAVLSKIPKNISIDPSAQTELRGLQRPSKPPEPATRSPKNSAPSMPPAGVAAAAGDVIDVETLMDNLGTSREMLAELIDCFSEETAAQLRETAVALRARDGVSLARCLHSIKGGVANFSVGETYRLCAELEQLALHETWERVPELSEQLLCALQNLMATLRNIQKECVR